MGRIDLINADTVSARLLAIPEKLRQAVEREALGEANKLAVGRLRENAPSETGALKKSLVYDIRKYKGGNVLAGIIGANNDYVGTVSRNKSGKKVFNRGDSPRMNRRPAKYFHLVELGTKNNVPATHFRKKTAEEIAPQVQQILEKAIEQALQ